MPTLFNKFNFEKCTNIYKYIVSTISNLAQVKVSSLNSKHMT